MLEEIRSWSDIHHSNHDWSRWSEPTRLDWAGGLCEKRREPWWAWSSINKAADWVRTIHKQCSYSSSVSVLGRNGGSSSCIFLLPTTSHGFYSDRTTREASNPIPVLSSVRVTEPPWSAIYSRTISTPSASTESLSAGTIAIQVHIADGQFLESVLVAALGCIRTAA